MQRDEQFFVNVVVPTVNEYLLDPTNLRRGFLAAVVLYHMSDYWANQTGGTVQNLRQNYPEFNVINDIADAAKHCNLRNTSRIISRSDQVNSTPHPGLFQANFGSGTFAEASEVIATPDNGTPMHLKSVVKAVLSMWRNYYPS
jgi:hypothetical protein